MYRLLFPLLLAVPAFAQTPANPPPSAVPLGTIDGHVTNQQTGEAIAGASVRFVPMTIAKTAASERTATTKADGSFHLDNVMAGTYVVMASHPGFVSNRAHSGRPRAITVKAGQQVRGVSLQINPAATISGTVLDGDGKAVPKAIVAIFRIRSVHGTAELHQAGSTTGSVSGKYSFSRLRPGSYYIVAGPNGPMPKAKARRGAPQLPFVRTFYPGALNIRDATQLQAAAGQNLTGVNITLVRSAQHCIRGTIAGFSNLAPGHTTVTLALRNGLEAVGLDRTVRPNKAGVFGFCNVLPGSYTLWLRGLDAGTAPNPMVHPKPRIITRQDLDVGHADVLGIALPVMPPIELTGQVTLDSSNHTKVNLSPVHVTLTMLEDLPGPGMRSAHVEKDGSFSFKHLEPARYVLRATNGPKGTYLKSISVNKQDVTHTGIDLTAGGSGQVDIVFRPGAGSVEGTIEADQNRPSAAATVILIPETLDAGGAGLLFGAGRPGDTFTINNVPPGNYYALAVARYDPAAWQNTAFIREVELDGASLEVHKGSQAQVQLPVVSLDQLHQAAVRLGLDF